MICFSVIQGTSLACAACRIQLLNFLKCFQDYCGRSSDSRNPKNLHPAFLKLAEYTSGQVIMFHNLGELERLNNWAIKMMKGYVLVTGGSNEGSRKRRSPSGPTDSRYTIPVDDSVENMFVTINTAVEGTGLVGCLWSLTLVLSTSVSGLMK